MATILVVEDHADSGELVARLLRREGHCVHHVTSGREALEAMEGVRFALVVLDHMMPGMSGDEVLRLLRSHPDRLTRAVPVVVFSAVLDPELTRRVIELGAQDYVVKSGGWGDLYRRLRPFL